MVSVSLMVPVRMPQRSACLRLQPSRRPHPVPSECPVRTWGTEGLSPTCPPAGSLALEGTQTGHSRQGHVWEAVLVCPALLPCRRWPNTAPGEVVGALEPQPRLMAAGRAELQGLWRKPCAPLPSQDLLGQCPEMVG